MFRWMPAVVLLMPRWMASVSTVVLLVSCVVFMIWMTLQPYYVAGTVNSIASVHGKDQIIVEVIEPHLNLFDNSETVDGRLIIADQYPWTELDSEKVMWVLALGASVTQLGGYEILQADKLIMLPTWIDINTALGHTQEAVLIPVVAIIIGAVFLIAGPLLSRFLSSVMLSVMLGVVTWHGLYIARFIGAISLIDELITALCVVAMITGLIIGLRARRDMSNVVIERLALLLLVIISVPMVADRFELFPQTFLIGMTLLTLISPLFGYALLGGYWMALGRRDYRVHD